MNPESKFCPMLCAGAGDVTKSKNPPRCTPGCAWWNAKAEACFVHVVSDAMAVLGKMLSTPKE